MTIELTRGQSRWADPVEREKARARNAKYYERHRDKIRARNAEYRKLNREEIYARLAGRRAENKAYLYKLKSQPCMDCKQSFDPYCMDFDHVRGEKKFNLARYGCLSLKQVKEEAAKCEVVCANCHRLRTKNRLESRGIDSYDEQFAVDE